MLRGDQSPRLVHLGLGSFHRSHQAWYVNSLQSSDPGWAYHSFAVNSRELVDRLSSQGGKYTLVQTVQGSETEFTQIDSISKCGVSSDSEEFNSALASETTSCVTLTISEGGYSDTRKDGAIGRLSSALFERFRKSGAPLTVISCDNLPKNGSVTKNSILKASKAFEPDFHEWFLEYVEFPNTMVDRITPNPSSSLSKMVRRETGFEDQTPVLTEKYSEWFIEGQRNDTVPPWQNVGVRYVDDVSPFENRKLWLLNGAHSLMSYLGQLRQLENVASAMCDKQISPTVESLWEEVSSVLPGEGLEDYIASLRLRFENPHINHSLEKISQNGPSKIRTRWLPVMKKRAIELGEQSPALATAIAAWITFSTLNDKKTWDEESEQIFRDQKGITSSSIREIMRRLDQESAENDEIIESILEAQKRLNKELV